MFLFCPSRSLNKCLAIRPYTFMIMTITSTGHAGSHYSSLRYRKSLPYLNLNSEHDMARTVNISLHGNLIHAV